MSDANDSEIFSSLNSDETAANQLKTKFSSNVTSDRIQHIASSIYLEFDLYIKEHGDAFIKNLIPNIVTLLETMDDMCRDQELRLMENENLKDENKLFIADIDKLKKTKNELIAKVNKLEDYFEEERKKMKSELDTIKNENKQLAMKHDFMQEQNKKLEKNSTELKSENKRLHESVSELIKNNVELMDRLKIPLDSTKDTPLELPKAETRKRSSKYETTDAFGFDEMPTMESINPGDDLPDDSSLHEDVPVHESNNSHLNTQNTDDDQEFAGMRKEINLLLKEHMDLLETQQALNVVKDDLLTQIDKQNMENLQLKNLYHQSEDSRENVEKQLRVTEQELSNYKCELQVVKAELQAKDNEEKSIPKSQKKRFTSAELNRVLSERNRFKKDLMDLEEAVRQSEIYRNHFKGQKNMLLMSGSELIKSLQTSSRPSSTTPQPERSVGLFSLQKFFSSIGTMKPDNSDNLSQSSVHSNHIANELEAENHEWIAIHRDLANKSPEKSLKAADAKTSLIDLENLRHKTLQLSNENSFEIFVALTIPKNYLSNASSDLILLSGIAPGSKGVVKIYSIHPATQCLVQFELPEDFSPYSGTICNGQYNNFEEIFKGTTNSPIDPEDFIRIPPEAEIDPKTTRIVLASLKSRILIYRFTDSHESNYDLETSFFLTKGMEMPRNFNSYQNLALFATCNNSLCLIRTPIRDAKDCVSFKSDELDQSGGPMILTPPDALQRIWLGTIGGGILKSFSLKNQKFSPEKINLPESSKCLHFILPFRSQDLQDYLYASVSGDAKAHRQVELFTEGIARLLIFSTNPDDSEVSLLHNIDFTPTLEKCIESTSLSEPVDLTLNRFMIHENKQIWLITRGGIIFNCTYDELISEKSSKTLYPIYLSCHCFRRPLSHIFSAVYNSDREKNVIISVGHEYLRLFHKSKSYITPNTSTRSGSNMILWS